MDQLVTIGFKSSSDRIDDERIARAQIKGRELSFGVSYLDDATRGILPNDLVLIGAPTGMGKTELCVQIALANLQNGKRVHFIALEAEKYEIERRLLFPLLANSYYGDIDRPKINGKLNMTDWILGKFDDVLSKHEDAVINFFKDAFRSLFTFYKADKFGVDELIYNVMSVCDDTDLIIIDHIHYFDWDEDNDNKAIKNIAKTVRDICLEIGKPVVLVAHLRKKDKGQKDLAAGSDEFHGSSDLTKIATKVITISGADVIDDKYVTYFRIAKNRMDGSVTRFIAQCFFDYKVRRYDDEYKIGFSSGGSFDECTDYPFWSRHIGPVVKRQSATFTEKSLPRDE